MVIFNKKVICRALSDQVTTFIRIVYIEFGEAITIKARKGCTLSETLHYPMIQVSLEMISYII